MPDQTQEETVSNNEIPVADELDSVSMNSIMMMSLDGTEETSDFTFNAETQTIVDCIDNPTKDLVIPAQIGEVEVLHIADGVFSARALTSVTFETGSQLQTIGNQSFYNNPAITVINLPESVTSIGTSAFENCTGLTTINIPNGMESVNSRTFYGCSKLSSVTMGTGVASIDSYAFYNCTQLTSIDLSGVTSIGSYAFQSAGITSVIFNENLTSIGSYAFSGCNITNDVVLPDALVTLGSFAFASNEFTEFTFGTGISTIPTYVLNGCSKLQVIYLPLLEGDYLYLSNLGDYGARVFAGSIVDGHYVYEINGTESTVVGYIGEGGELTIPNSFTYNGENISVTSLDDKLFYGNQLITKITVPSSIADIGTYTFYNCDSLIEVDLSQTTITTVGSRVFYDCDKLAIVSLTDTVTSIGEYAFYSCNQLKTINVPNELTNIQTYAFGYADSLSSIDLSNASSLTSIEDYAFFYAKLTTITLPESLTTIGNSAFNLCELTTITLPESLTSIGSSAFYSNDFQSVTIPSKVTVLQSSVFSQCTLLAAITFNGDITTIYDSFLYNTKVTEVTIPASITTISSTAFSGANSLKKITIDKEEDSIANAPWGSTTATVYWNDTQEIDGYIFSTKENEIRKYVGSDTDITVPASFTIDDTVYNVEKVSEYAFANCTTLEKVDLQDLDFLTNLPSYIFYGCSSLNEVILPDTTVEIGNYAFYNCTLLSSLSLPEGITNIGNYSFYYCSSLISLNIPSSVKTVGTYAFSYAGITSFNFVAVETIGSSAFRYSELTEDLVFGNKLSSLGTYAFADTDIQSITFPDQLTYIPEGIVYQCYSLIEVNMGDKVTSIGHSAFYLCNNLTNIHLSESLTSISYKMLANCTNLSTLVIPTSVTTIQGYYTYSGYGPFYNCTSLTSLTLPEGITTLGAYLFQGSGITQLQIPSTVTSMYTTTLTGMNSLTTVFVNQNRGDQDFHKNAPWGASTSPTVYFKGEAVVIRAEITLSSEEYKAIINLWTEEEEGLIVKEIIYPDGVVDEAGNKLTVGSNTGSETWSETVYVTENGSYTFRGLAKEVYSEFTFVVEGIGKPVITTEDSITVTPTMVQEKFTTETLINAMNATATDGVKDLDITLATGNIDAVNNLTASNSYTTVTLSATSNYEGDITTKNVTVYFLTRDTITIQDHNQKQVYSEELDVEREINIMNSESTDEPTHTYKVGYISTITLPEPYSKTGYTFVEWVVTEPDEGAITITPIYTINKYTVTFNTQEGSTVANQSCDYNTTATKPTDPTRDWYAFAGWYTEDTCQTEYDFEDKITGDITLYAKWDHVHDLAYTVVDDVITATCTHGNEDCAYYENNYIAGTLTLHTPTSLVAQDGDKEFTCTKDTNWEANIVDEVTLEYYNGNTSLGEAPTTRGNYTVKVLVGNTIVYTKSYEITNAIITPETVFKDYNTVSSSWTNTEITFGQADSDYTFSLTEDGPYTTSISFAELNDGTKLYTVYVSNATDGVVYITTLTYYLENTDPTFGVSGEPTDWQSETVTLTITNPSDTGGSGLANEPYSFDHGSTWTNQTTCNFDENKEVTICVKDAAGNIASQIITELKVDQTKPENVAVTFSPENEDGSNDWYKNQVTISMKVPTYTDLEAPVTSYYKLWNDGATEPTEGTKFISDTSITPEDGKWNLVTYTVDEAGNESGKSETYSWMQDTANPTVTSLSYDTTVTFLDWILGKESVEITINVSDDMSQVDAVEVVLKEVGEIEAKDKSLSVTDGVAILVVNAEWKGDIAFMAIDKAGNSSDIYCMTENNDGIIVEHTKPTISLDVSAANEFGWYTEDVTIEATVADSGISSGIEEVSYVDTNSDNKETTVIDSDLFENAFIYTHNFEVEVKEDGIHTVTFDGKDHAGNEADTVIIEEIKIDQTAPVIKITYEDIKWTNGNEIDVTFEATDATSGISSIKVTKGQDTYIVTTENGISTFAATENGTYTVIVTDVAGNKTTETVEVTKFDRTLPEIEWSSETNAILDASWYGPDQVKGQIVAVESNTTANITGTSSVTITYVINGVDEEVSTVTLSETGIYEVKAIITDEAGNSNFITKTIQIEKTIDEFNSLMENVDENSSVDTIAANKTVYDNYSSLIASRLAKNDEAFENVEKLLALFAANEEEALLKSKIQEIENIIDNAYVGENHWVNKTAIALYDALSDEEKELVSEAVTSKYETLVSDSAMIDEVIALVNAASKPSDASYIELITTAETANVELNTTTGTTIPQETQELLTQLVAYRDDANRVNGMPLTTYEEILAAKKAYSALEPYAQAMVDVNSIEIAYNTIVNSMEADEKALALFREQLDECLDANTITMSGIADLEKQYNQLSESAKDQLTQEEEDNYGILVATHELYNEFINTCNGLNTTDREAVRNLLDEYKDLENINIDLNQALVENSVTISLEELQVSWEAAQTVEQKLLELNEKINLDQIEDSQSDIEALKEAMLDLSDKAYVLLEEDTILKINELYEFLIKELEFIHTASSVASSVEVVGLTDKVELPTITTDIVQTVVKVVMQDSTPVVVPVVYEKELVISSDIKLVSVQTDEEGNQYEEYVQPMAGQSVLLKLEVPAGYELDTLEIIHVKDDGSRNVVPAVKVITENGVHYAIFQIDSFSHFMVYATKIKTPTSSNSGTTSTTVVTPVVLDEVEEIEELEEIPEEVITELVEKEIAKADDTENVDDGKDKYDTIVTKPEQDEEVMIDVPQIPVEESDYEEFTVVEKESDITILTYIMVALLASCIGLWFWFFFIWKRRKDEEEEEEEEESLG